MSDWEQYWLKPSWAKGPTETVIMEMWKYHTGNPNVNPHHQHQDWYDSLFTDDDGDEYESITPETRFRLKAVLDATPAHIKDKITVIHLNELNRRSRRYVAETNEGNFSETMEPHISYEVSFTSSLPMDEDYDYDDRIIQDYVEELIRDDGSRKGFQAFEFVMGSGWYSGAIIDGTVTWWTGNYSAETFEADYVSCDNCGDSYSDANNTDLGCQCEICPTCVMEYEGNCPECARMDAETFQAPSYGSYYGACLLPDGSCTETSLDMCRALGGRFQGPGTSCYPDAGWARPRVMQAEGQSRGLGRGLTIGIVAGIISGLVTTVFGTVISEILLDRLREDPELEITEEDPGTNTPHL